MMLLAMLAVAIAFGWIVIEYFNRELSVNVWGKLGLSYLLGVGIYTWLLYLLTLVGLNATKTSVVLLMAGAITAGIVLQRRAFKVRAILTTSFLLPHKIVNLAQVLLLAPLFVLVGVVAYQTPMYFNDSIYYYDGLGRVFSIDGNFYGPALESEVFIHGLQSLMLQVLHGVTYLFDVDQVGVFYAGFYMALVLVFGFVRWEAARSSRSRGWLGVLPSVPWRILTLCIATTPFVFAMGYVVLSNLPAAAYYVAGAIIWKRVLDKPTKRIAVLSGILFALAAWTRSDAIYFYVPVAAITFLASVNKKEIRSILIPLVLPPLMMDVSRYAFVLISGQIGTLPQPLPIPFAELLIHLSVLGVAVLLSRANEDALEWVAFIFLGAIVVGIVGIGSLAVVNSEGVRSSAQQLWALLTDPVWGITGALVIIGFFSLSLIEGTSRFLLLLILALILLRILLYAEIIDLNLADELITQSGNRVLLYIWPLVFYWLSGSEEFRRWFTYSRWRLVRSRLVSRR